MQHGCCTGDEDSDSPHALCCGATFRARGGVMPRHQRGQQSPWTSAGAAGSSIARLRSAERPALRHVHACGSARRSIGAEAPSTHLGPACFTLLHRVECSVYPLS